MPPSQLPMDLREEERRSKNHKWDLPKIEDQERPGGRWMIACWRCILVHLACSLHFGLDLIMELTCH
jgi:hypothetical protein